MTDVTDIHRTEHGDSPDVVVSAPGVVNLVGTHTEESGGLVLMCALDRRVTVALSKRPDTGLRFFAYDLGERKRTQISAVKFRREDRWANYLKGVVYEIVRRGWSIRGVNVTVTGDVPTGIGLGSSVAMSAAFASAIAELFELDMTYADLVECVTTVEGGFVGGCASPASVHAVFFSRPNAAFLFDAATYEYRPIPAALNHTRLIVADAGVRCAYDENEHRRRLEDGRTCRQVMQKINPQSNLRTCGLSELEEPVHGLSETSRRRCKHIVMENDLVNKAIVALERGDLATLGRVLVGSHASLRDLFEVSCPELDWLVRHTCETEGVYGSRLAGAGAASSVLTLLDTDALARYRVKLGEYERIFGFSTSMYECTLESGVRVHERV